jgi:hypothetical protein
MKIRNSFVSNSSSTSFIVAIDPGSNPPCPHCGRSDFNILERIRLLGSDDCDDTCIRADGAQAVIDYSDWIDSEEMGKLIPIIKDYDTRGFQVAYIDISYHDDSLNNEFQALVKLGRLVVIKDLN